MTRIAFRMSYVGLMFVMCTCAFAATDNDVTTTAGAIAIANLDHLIAQHGDEGDIVELLLLRSRFLGDYEALDRATRIVENRFATTDELLQRGRTRAAVHRFADALGDVEKAEVAGTPHDEIVALRASTFVAIGRAGEVVPQLEANVARRAGFASHSALAVAYAAVGRIDDAERLYISALEDLHTTSRFPYAWIEFARGVMWAEQGAAPVRAKALYARALEYLPQFVAANIHLAELEAADGDVASAIHRLERVATSGEPEALALLGQLRIRTGDARRGRNEIAHARERYESLLACHPLAFADHAAEFYLGPGADARRAWTLAQQNLANRQTDRAFALAIRAAQATSSRKWR
jgi:tetratricopeptide (TPR) repeat protein